MNWLARRDPRRRRAERILNHLSDLISVGAIPPRLGSVLEFGAGSGTGTRAIKQLADSVDAVEILDTSQIIAYGILPGTQVYHGDGIGFMRSRPGRYSTVFASMLGPLSKSETVTRFRDAALTALTPGGRILVTTDGTSMKQFSSAPGRILHIPGFCPAYIEQA